MIELKPLENLLKIEFKDKDLFFEAFTHKSYFNENKGKGIKHNERLEFLGDAVLELVITNKLFLDFPDDDEGMLTSFRSALVNRTNLANTANKLNLGDYLLLSKGEISSGGSKKDYILANVCEALIGAIYLDEGYDTASKFILEFIYPSLKDILSNKLYIDAKSKLQELIQAKGGKQPIYKLIEETGPDHQKDFLMAVYFNDHKIGEGTGSSKQKAELEAAKNALNIKAYNNIL